MSKLAALGIIVYGTAIAVIIEVFDAPKDSFCALWGVGCLVGLVLQLMYGSFNGLR